MTDMEYVRGHTIRVEYAGPTDTKGSRWVASWEDYFEEGGRPVRQTVGYYECDTDQERFELIAQRFLAWFNRNSELAPASIRKIYIIHTNDADVLKISLQF